MAVPFKNGADLYNHEVLRMRLHNLGADPTEVGAGLIYFNTSNDLNTSKKARIYTGDAWKTFAFVEDLDVASNADFIALQEKVALLAGDVDTDAIISNMKEVSAFLEGFAEDASLMGYLTSELGKKFDKSGGVITGDLTYNSNLQSGTYIRFRNANGIIGYLGVSAAKNGIFSPDGSAYYTLLHSGNVGEYALKTDGSNTMTNGLQLYTLGSGSANVPLTDGMFIYRGPSTGGVDVGLPDSFTNVLNIGGSTAYSNLQLAWFRSMDVLKLYARVGEAKGYGAWKEILHTGNYSDLITTLNKTLSVPSITIGGIRLSVVDGRLQIDGNAYATGELAAGGAGEEGSDDMGLALLENWADYDATKAQALGAVLGKDMYDRIVTLEGKSTNVQFTPTLASGKQIGAITIDGVTTGIFAPSSYAWSEIDGRPTSLSQFTDDVVSGKYLPLSGGRMDGILIMNHVNASDKVSYIIFKDHRINNTPFADYVFRVSDSNGSFLGGFGLKGDTNGIDYYFLGKNGSTSENNLRLYSDRAAWGSSTILHSGNVGDYAFIARGRIHSDTNANSLLTNGVYLNETGNGSNNSNFPDNYSILTTFAQSSAFVAQISIGLDVKVRRKIDSWTDWKTIAFTDSDITGNAATATKLATPRTIWGQSFDGTGNVSGSINGDVADFRVNAYDGSARYNIIDADSNNAVLYFGYGSAPKSYKTRIAGESVVLHYGTSKNVGLILNPNGNVTIGNSDLAGSDYKLYVSGKGLFTGAITANAGINLANRTYIRGMLTDGTTNALLLGINQSDGFLIGYGVMTAASTSVYGKSVTLHANGEAASFRINEYGNVTLGTPTDKATDTYGLYVGKALPSYFANRVLIGGTDDGSTRFQVNGTSAFGGQSTFNALALFNESIVAKDTLQIGDATLSWDADKNALKVDKSIYSDGEVSAGGAGEEGETESTGNASAWAQTFTPTNTTMPFEHNRATTDVIVQVYEKNDGGSWDMILVDVEIISETKVNLHFGRTENREHKIVIMG